MHKLIAEAMEEHPHSWWLTRHMVWGMRTRNILRENGFGEKELGVRNLDDVYIGLVEEAVRV